VEGLEMKKVRKVITLFELASIQMPVNQRSSQCLFITTQWTGFFAAFSSPWHSLYK
jgi:hypothetical protein